MTNTIEPKIWRADTERIVARWETRGKDFLQLSAGTLRTTDEAGNVLVDYSYSGNACGGGFWAQSDEEAIARMESPWGAPCGVGQVTVLKSDRASLKRIF